MFNRYYLVFAAIPFVWACGATMPEPTQRLADAESASRSAREVGADNKPEARLHVKLANEQIASAKRHIAAGDNERATYELLRARSDAELALALTREQDALVEKQRAVELANVTLTANVAGAKP